MELNQIATKADIEKILDALINLQQLLSTSESKSKYLRSADVRKLLNISDGTLQRLRISKSLDAKKVNGTWFYKMQDITKMLEDKK